MRIHPAVSCLLFAAFLGNPLLAQFAVSSVTPANAARAVSPAASVTLTFTAAVDAATITAQNIKLSGRWSGPVPGTLSIGAGGTTVTFTPQRPLFATEIATLTVTHFVTSTTGAPLIGGYFAMWWVASAPSSGNYVLDHVVDYRLPGEGLIRTYGFFAGDIDRDGSPDMSATDEVAFDIRLLKNSGCGFFGPKVITQLPAGHEPSPNEGADFNGDGWLDLATGNQNGNSVAVFLNDGAGNYLPPLVLAVGGAVHGLALVDCDSDGDVDILATNQSDLVLLRSNGNGTFQAPTFFDGGGSGEWSVAVGDANGDGKPDIFCGTYGTQNVTLLLGDGNGNFTISAAQTCGGFPWQMAVGDVNGDGNLDCVVAESSNARAAIVTGNGVGGLNAVVGYPVGGNPVSVDIGDIEGDGDLDIVVASFSAANAVILRNDGTGVFGNATTLPTTAAGSCAVIVDYDRDGDTDVIVVDELDDKGFVYRQDGPNAPAVQPPSCDAALRVNGFANRGGYGTAPAHLLPGGSVAFLNVSGAPLQLFAVFVGAQLAGGAPSPFGLVNLDPGQTLSAALDGLLDGSGEVLLPLLVPNGLPLGSTLTLQCILTTPTNLVLSNPEQLVF